MLPKLSFWQCIENVVNCSERWLRKYFQRAKLLKQWYRDRFAAVSPFEVKLLSYFRATAKHTE